MEQYREKLRISTIVTAIACIILAVFVLLGFAGEVGLIPFLTPVGGDSHWHSMWRGIITGASCCALTLMVYGLSRNLAALKDEQKLKQFYVKEHDERQLQIWTFARASAMQVFLILGVVAAVVAGYFSMTVSMTILACVFAHALIGIGFKIYYSKRF